MALTSSFGFGVSTPSGVDTEAAVVPVVSGFGTRVDDPEEYSAVLAASPIDQQEMVTYQCKRIKNIATRNTISNPSKVDGGIQYVIRLDEVLTTTSSTDDTYRVDDPVVMYLTVRHPATSRITDSLLDDVFERLIGSAMDSNGKIRWSDLAKSALRPSSELPVPTP